LSAPFRSCRFRWNLLPALAWMFLAGSRPIAVNTFFG